MDAYYGLIHVGLAITAGVTLLYGILAPWHKSETGKSFFGLLLALTLLLANSSMRIAFARAEWTLWAGIILFIAYCLAMVFIGWNIFKAQVGNYLKRKRERKEVS